MANVTEPSESVQKGPWQTAKGSTPTIEFKLCSKLG